MKAPVWLRHWGLSESPFDKDINAEELWLPSSKDDIVTQLVDAAHAHQHMLLTGEPGIGKTCTLRALRQRLPDEGFRLTYCSNATLGRRDFYRQLCRAVGLAPKATAAAVFDALAEHVEQLGRESVHAVFLIDEAHLLRQDVLDHLHVLANYQWDQKPLLSIALVGLPELWTTLTLRKNRSLWSRIHCRVGLTNPGPADTVEYLQYRLGRVGARKGVFASDALTLLHEGTGGLLRDIDRIATAALQSASRRKLEAVDRDVVRDVLKRDTAPPAD